jgi:two-component system response regulator YesN
MPFMDGLQLSKIIILSGYDEFEYAQTALKIGVTEYLLKPVSAADIVDVLKRVTVALDQEKSGGLCFDLHQCAALWQCSDQYKKTTPFLGSSFIKLALQIVL